jgi:hypothetical protein
VAAFIGSVMEGGGQVISFEEIHSTSLAVFKTLASLRTGEKQKL